MKGERLLGSYLVRVSVGAGGRRLVVHSVRSGERHECADFEELARHLEAETARPGIAPRRRGPAVSSDDDEPT